MNSKKRKLKYIRQKNYYRNGGYGVSFFKVSSSLDDDVIGDIIGCNIQRDIKKLNKKYKLNFKSFGFETGYSEDDLLKDILSIKFKFKKK